jgi:hypothetical protein
MQPVQFIGLAIKGIIPATHSMKQITSKPLFIDVNSVKRVGTTQVWGGTKHIVFQTSQVFCDPDGFPLQDVTRPQLPVHGRGSPV